MWLHRIGQKAKGSSGQFRSKRKALVFKETSIIAQPVALVKETEKSTQTLSWPDECVFKRGDVKC